jgi:hypothetical protein
VLDLKKNDPIKISCNHDEYSLWFDVYKKNFEKQNGHKNGNGKIDCERSLGVTIVSRNRLGQLNDLKRNNMFMKVLEKVIITRNIFGLFLA